MIFSQSSKWSQTMPIPHVFQMNEIIPTTDNSGRRLLTGGPNVRDNQAKNNDINHG